MRWRFLRSATARLMAIVFLLQVAATGAVLLSLRVQTNAALTGERRERIETVREDALAAYYDGGAPALRSFVATRTRDSEDAGLLLLLRLHGRSAAGNVAALGAVPERERWFTTAVRETGAAATAQALVTEQRLPGGVSLLVGHTIGADIRLKRAFEGGLVATVLLGLLLAGLVALVTGRIVSQRTRAIAATTRALGAGEFHARVPEDGSGDGFDRLRREVNIMAERIEALVGELRLVTDGLAHDLRTPVMRLKAAIERAAHDPEDALLAEISSEADLLLAMLSTALEIARVEGGMGTERQALQDVGAIVAGIVEIYQPYAEDHDVAVTSDIAVAHAVVDRELLARAVSNLLDNALKYGGRTIAVAVAPAADAVLVTVADDGPGIAPDDRAAALRRFGRLDEARTQPGAGLGLSLVAAVAHAHGGTLALEDNAPGLSVVMRLPR